MIKLRIKQRHDCPFLWTCRLPGSSHMFGKVGLGDTPEQAYRQYFNPKRLCGLNDEWFSGEKND